MNSFQAFFRLSLKTMVRYGKNLPSWLGKLLVFSLLLMSVSCSKSPQPDTNPTPPPSDTPPTNPDVSTNPPSESLIDDLEDGDATNKQGQPWFTYNDKDSKGDSQVSPSGDFKPSAGGNNNSSWASQMKGKVTKTYEYGFIGMGTNLSKDNKTGVDISKYKGIEFCAKGDGKEYRMQIASVAISDYDYYYYKFVAPATWTCYQISFDQMKQQGVGKPIPINEALAQSTAILWDTVGQPHESVDLAVDDIKFMDAK